MREWYFDPTEWNLLAASSYRIDPEEPGRSRRDETDGSGGFVVGPGRIRARSHVRRSSLL
jgi:hypothetical protein